MYLRKMVLPLSSSVNTAALVIPIICLGTSPKRANCQHVVMRLLPVCGVAPPPERVIVVENPLCAGCRILYRYAAVCEQKLAEIKH